VVPVVHGTIFRTGRLTVQLKEQDQDQFPSGQVTLTQSVIWMILQIGLAGIILLSYNLNSIILGLSSLFLVAIYPFAKRFTWWPQGVFGPCIQLGNTFVVRGPQWSLSWPIVILYIAGIFLDLYFMIQFTPIRTAKMTC
jgi:4-hydroxybenzoate polyprenyltransferase